LIAWSLGGRRAAQFLAMLCVLVAPCYLGGDGYLSMNSFESIFWMGCILALIFIVKGASPKWWLLVGVCGGLGLQNKASMTFFLVALIFGLLVTPQRRLLRSRWFAASVAVTVLIALPNIFWQIHYHWPTWEFLQNGRAENKNVVVSPPVFLLEQIATLHPLNVFVWGAGLVWLLASPRARNFRWIGTTYLFFLALMMALHAKDYYLVPIYPMLFAAGGLAWEGAAERSRARIWRIGAFAAVLVITAAVIFPMASPVLPPEQWLRYTQALHLRSRQQEKYSSGPLPQFYADRFGWQEMVDQVTRIYNSLSP
jgi:4-amino-4-deoxy-L-arabinose transferase-like glycosyltransferase